MKVWWEFVRKRKYEGTRKCGKVHFKMEEEKEKDMTLKINKF